MFSYLSRGYGTWEGIAKLEKPESASDCRNYDILPPIKKDPLHFCDDNYERVYRIQKEQLKLPEVPKSSLHIPKTYSTKSGALLLYSEGCFVPGSRRLKKRPRFKRQKEKSLQTMKDFMEIIMDYKKNGCDPLLLEQLWQRMSGSARDVQPGYSPKRYLSHLSHTTFDQDSWKKLVETGSLKSFGTTDDSFLPSFLPNEYDYDLNHRPPPYKTMSLPPVSPSNSMVGSFTFYKHALSTGAASMVSLPSINSDTADDQLSARTVGSFVESLAERLAEVESEAGFKKDYETLTTKQKEELLTQLLMDVTLHNQGDVITVPTQTIPDSSTMNTDLSYLSDSKKSHESLDTQSHHSMQSYTSDKRKSISSNKSTKSLSIDRSLGSDWPQKSADSTRRLKSISSKTSSVCSLPPIQSKDNTSDRVDVENGSERTSSSHSGLSVVPGDFEVGLNSIDVEIDDDYLDDTGVDVERKVETRSLSEKTSSEYSLIDALNIEDGESIHELTDETRSLKSLGSSHGLMERSMKINENLKNVGIGDEEVSDGSLKNGMICDGNVDDDGSEGFAADVKDGEGRYGESYSNSEKDGDIPTINIPSGTDGDLNYHHDNTMPTIDVEPATPSHQEQPHMSLSNLQDEVRLVATQVLSRPKSGRTLAEDAEMATFLLLERMQGLLGPSPTVENARVSSAAPNKVRPLGQPKNSEIKGRKRVRSAEAILTSRSLVKLRAPQAELVSEAKQVEQAEKPVKQDAIADEKPVEQASVTDEKQVDSVSSEEKKPNVEVDAQNLSLDDVIITVDTNIENTQADNGAQAIEETSAAALSPADESLTIKDLQPEKQVEETKTEEVPAVKETKEIVHKETKGKKAVNTKTVTNKGKKKKSVVRKRSEQPKTPPFHAGLVPESKPPKGLADKTGKARKKANGKQASPDLKDKTEPKTNEPVKSPDVVSPEIPVRVDSETGEVDHTVSPVRSEKSPSLVGSKSPNERISHEEEVSEGGKTASPRSQSKSSRAESDSPREKSPYEKAPSSHDKTPSPREQKPCPRDRDAVFQDNVNTSVKNEKTNVVTETVDAPTREPSPEVVLTEKQRRANARAAQRAAAAERRRQEVERKRREREEARRRAQEEEARLEVLRKEAEEEMKKREEERRIQKEQEERERKRLEAEQNEIARQERLNLERQRQAREEWKRKKEQLMAQRKFEEELRIERERVEAQIEEERRKEYAEKIAHLEQEERERLLEERRLEEERIKREIQEEKERREAERLRMLEERRKMEEELAAARDRQLARRNFLEMLLRDFQNLLLNQRITRAFSFSYFDILPWFKDRWKDLEEDRPLSKRTSTSLDTVPEESESEIDQLV